MRTEFNRRLYMNHTLCVDQDLVLDREQSHYLATVLRLKAGAKLALFNGKTGEWSAEVSIAEKRAVTLRIIEQITPPSPEPDVWLVFAPIKKTRIDFVAQKATELGASRLMPMFTNRTIAERVNTDRLHANAVEAAEQCERLTVPDVDSPRKLEAILDAWPPNRHIMFCDESLNGEPVLTALSNLRRNMPEPEPWAIFIGPEGGFDERERGQLNAIQHAHPVSLGPRILRADTAAMAALSIWQTVFGDWH